MSNKYLISGISCVIAIICLLFTIIIGALTVIDIVAGSFGTAWIKFAISICSYACYWYCKKVVEICEN